MSETSIFPVATTSEERAIDELIARHRSEFEYLLVLAEKDLEVERLRDSLAELERELLRLQRLNPEDVYVPALSETVQRLMTIVDDNARKAAEDS